jgi:hypothetical protein
MQKTTWRARELKWLCLQRTFEIMYGMIGVHVAGRIVDWNQDFYRSHGRSKGCLFSKIRTSPDWLIDIQRCVVCKSILHSPSYTTCLCSWCSYTNQSGLFPPIFLVLVLKDLANFWSSERSICAFWGVFLELPSKPCLVSSFQVMYNKKWSLAYHLEQSH